MEDSILFICPMTTTEAFHTRHRAVVAGRPGRSRDVKGCPWDIPRTFRGRPGRSWDIPGRPWDVPGRLRDIPGTFRDVPGMFWDVPSKYQNNAFTKAKGWYSDGIHFD